MQKKTKQYLLLFGLLGVILVIDQALKIWVKTHMVIGEEIPLIGDWCLQAQIHLFGQMVMDAQEAEAQAFKPRGMQDATKQKFEQLPSVFTPSDMVACGIVQNATHAATVALRWQKAGIIKKLERGKYQKIVTKL